LFFSLKYSTGNKLIINIRPILSKISSSYIHHHVVALAD